MGFLASSCALCHSEGTGLGRGGGAVRLPTLQPSGGVLP